MTKRFCDECGGEVKAPDASGKLRAQTKGGIVVEMKPSAGNKDVCYNCALNALVDRTPVVEQVAAVRTMVPQRAAVAKPGNGQNGLNGTATTKAETVAAPVTAAQVLAK